MKIKKIKKINWDKIDQPMFLSLLAVTFIVLVYKNLLIFNVDLGNFTNVVDSISKQDAEGSENNLSLLFNLLGKDLNNRLISLLGIFAFAIFYLARKNKSNLVNIIYVFIALNFVAIILLLSKLASIFF